MKVWRYNDLKDRVFSRGALILYDELEDLLTLNPHRTKEELFFLIVDQAINEYCKHYPFHLKQWVYTTDGDFSFESNLEEVIAGILDERRLNLIPQAIKGYTAVDIPRAILNRYFSYDAPNLKGLTMTGDILVYTLCRYPVITKGKYQGLYFLSEGIGTFNVFLDELTRQYLGYILKLKKNIELPQLPINFFSGIEDEFANLNQLLESTYTSGLGNGEVID